VGGGRWEVGDSAAVVARENVERGICWMRGNGTLLRSSSFLLLQGFVENFAGTRLRWEAPAWHARRRDKKLKWEPLICTN
jgi:hypothetical protein